jgi:spoIIIJ-associated protein
MQYLLNRIVSRKFPGVARIQLDAGDYREKQDEQLRKTAQLLAQKAKTSHRTQSTRPLSSYHRRVVHMALQDDRDILTRSKGDGPMKRVLIMARRKKNAVPPKEPKGAAPTAQPDALEDHQAS